MTKQELKDKYIDHKGFVLIGAVPSQETSIQKLMQTLKSGSLTTENPEIIVGFEDDKEYVFIYRDSTDFDMPAFFKFVSSFHVQMMFGNVFQFKTLREYLN